jgi:hypothetical protein
MSKPHRVDAAAASDYPCLMPARYIRWLVEIWASQGCEEIREISPPEDREWFFDADRAAQAAALRAEPALRDAVIRFVADGVDGIFLVYAGGTAPPLAPGEEEL